LTIRPILTFYIGSSNQNLNEAMPKNFLLRVCTALLLIIPSLNSAYSQTVITVSGVVKDKLDVPIPGVSVVIQNKPNSGTTTDAKGEFKLQANSNDVLVFSHTGYIEL